MGEETLVYKINVDDIVPNRFNPRLVFDQQALLELAKSIEQHGIIQPLVLRKIGDKYEIIAGERRLKAAKMVGLTKVPAVIMELTDKDSAEVAILENTQRTNLTPIEEARAYKKLLDNGFLIQDQLASRMGKSQSTVSNKLRLLNLSEAVQEALLNNAISERHARSLLQVIDQAEQERILSEIVSKRLNVRDTEKYIKEAVVKPEQEEVSTEETELEKTQILGPIKEEDEEPVQLQPEIQPEEQDSIQIEKEIQPEEQAPIQEPINLELETKIEMPKEDIGESSIPELSSVGQVEAPNITGLSPANNFVIEEDKKPDNKFLFDVAGEDFVEDNESIAEQPQINQTVDFNPGTSNSVMGSVDKIKQLVNELKAQNIDIKLEEFNFDTIYQLNIKIQKK